MYRDGTPQTLTSHQAQGRTALAKASLTGALQSWQPHRASGAPCRGGGRCTGEARPAQSSALQLGPRRLLQLACSSHPHDPLGTLSVGSQASPIRRPPEPGSAQALPATSPLRPGLVVCEMGKAGSGHLTDPQGGGAAQGPPTTPPPATARAPTSPQMSLAYSAGLCMFLLLAPLTLWLWLCGGRTVAGGYHPVGSP